MAINIFTRVVFLITIIFAFNLCYCKRAMARSGFGGYCNDTIKCEKRSMLTCHDAECNCLLLDKMIYDPTTKQCVSKIGETCKFGIPESGRSADRDTLYEILGCVKDATCSSAGICECNSQFYESFEGQCAPKGFVNETCTADIECRSDKFLECVDGNCNCNSTFSVWSEEKGKCAGKAGLKLQVVDSCVSGSKLNNEKICICEKLDRQQYTGSDGNCYRKKSRNSTCTTDDECVFHYRYLSCVNGTCDCDPNLRTWKDDVKLEYYSGYNEQAWDSPYKTGQCIGLAGKPSTPSGLCVKNSQPANGYCFCTYGYSETAKGTCAKSHGSHCSKNEECTENYMCTNGICNCPDTKHQIYNKTNQKCESIISGPCQYSSDCVQNASCEQIPKYASKRCRCITGFIETAEGKCQLAYGSACDYNKQKSSTRSSGSSYDSIEPEIESKCDVIGGLVCRNGMCECPESLSYFHQESRKCLDRVGSRCTRANSCVPNASCRNLEPYGNPIPGNCECDKWYVPTPEKLCEIRDKLAPIGFTTISGNISEDEVDEFVVITG